MTPTDPSLSADEPPSPPPAGPPSGGPASLDPAVARALLHPGWRARLDDLTGGWRPTPVGLVGAVAALAVAIVALVGLPAGRGADLAALPMARGAGGPAGAGTGDGTTTSPSGAPGAVVVAGTDGSPGSVPGSTPATVVVHAAGAVVAPGVHHLPAGARVDDVLAAAGGPTPDADVDALNLAAPVADGARVRVPRLGEPPTAVVDGPAVGGAAAGGGAGGPTGHGVGGPISLSTATEAELDELPGVGPATAAAILAHRQATGGFRTVDELLDVRGIGEAKLEQLRPLVVP